MWKRPQGAMAQSTRRGGPPTIALFEISMDLQSRKTLEVPDVQRVPYGLTGPMARNAGGCAGLARCGNSLPCGAVRGCWTATVGPATQRTWGTTRVPGKLWAGIHLEIPNAKGCRVRWYAKADPHLPCWQWEPESVVVDERCCAARGYDPAHIRARHFEHPSGLERRLNDMARPELKAVHRTATRAPPEPNEYCILLIFGHNMKAWSDPLKQDRGCPVRLLPHRIRRCSPRVPPLRALALAVMLSCSGVGLQQAYAQGNPPYTEQTDSIHGTVVNSVTHEPVGRALVSSPDNRFATMTDDQGRFEFRGGPNRPPMLTARKPGFLAEGTGMQNQRLSPTQKELTIFLVPEALIIGRVVLPTAGSSDQIQLELYRRQFQEGRAHWVSAGVATTKSNGEFRFAELPSGRYKLFTHESMDSDPLTADPRGRLYGYPPIYFPAARDFASAGTIQLSAGSTFHADLSPVRQAYYPVKVGVTNAPPGARINILVFVQGHKGPGYSLGYGGAQVIEGLLPNGAYTVEASSFGPNPVAGVLNFTVRGAAVEGPTMTLVSTSSVAVNVREEFSSTEGAGIRSYAVSGSGQSRGRYFQVRLLSADDFAPGNAGSPRSATGPENESLVIEGVSPGRYWVRVHSSRGYVASIRSGGEDLLRQPLVVGLGSSYSIELTLRDDGAGIEGTIEGAGNSAASARGPASPRTAPPAYVYCVPLPDSTGQFREMWVSSDGTFQFQQLPPGGYRVLAFDRPQSELEYLNPEAMRQYDAKGQVVRLAATQREHLRLQVISTGE